MFFSIFWESRIISKMTKLSMIKKFSCGKILDKVIFMSVAFSAFSKKLVILF
jgi:hypothetical protein